MSICILVLFFFRFLHIIAFSDKPLGVPISKLSFYTPGVPFKCLDGSHSIAWEYVNDDYCDCADGSDEPGTSACSNGFFYCENHNHKALLIPSSRVNDGVCDCCDGSDEYNSILPCTNECWELGKAAREALMEKKRLTLQGKVFYNDFVRQSKESIKSKNDRLVQLETEIQALEESQIKHDEAKKAAEEPEKTIIEEIESQHELLKQEWKNKQDAFRINQTFLHLDTNVDSMISSDEIKVRIELDSDSDGHVSDEEVNGYINIGSKIDYDVFKNDVWPKLNFILNFKSKNPTNIRPPIENEPQTDEELDAADQGLKSEQDPKIVPIDDIYPPELENEPAKPDIDESKQVILNEAERLRKIAEESHSNLSTLKSERDSLKTLLSRHYGKDSAFFILAQSNDCFEYSEREYIYTLCPFSKVNQKQISDSSTVNLGVFSRILDDGSHLYENGQGCWNGPNRSTKVSIVCGPENSIKNVQEPSRCEYSLTFITPAACDDETVEKIEKELKMHEDL